MFYSNSWNKFENAEVLWFQQISKFIALNFVQGTDNPVMNG